MRVRKMKLPPSNTIVYTLDGGDWIFGHGSQDYFIDVPDAVAQVCLTRLALNQGEWFLDTSDGTPWNTQVLGKFTGNVRDLIIQSRINGTPGLAPNGITSYSSSLGASVPRQFLVNANLTTIYSANQVGIAGTISQP